jgi:hypothetical protein
MINQLIFDNSGYTIAGTNALTFVGTGSLFNDEAGTQIISAPIKLNLSSDTLTIAIVNSGDTLTFSGVLSDTSGTSSLNLGNMANPNAGTLNITNTASVGGNISLNGGTYNNAKSMTAAGTLTIAGATVNSNNSSISPFSCSTTATGPILTAATVNISSGTITIDSSACGTLATAGVVGTRLQASTNALTISGGTVNVTNEAAITATGTGATGSLLTGAGGVTISGGAVNVTNSGTISGTDDIGAFLYNNSSVSGTAMVFSGGTVIVTNNGSATAGVGVLIQSGRQALINNPINVSGTASVTLTNTNNLSTTTAIGAYLSGGALTVSGGSLALSNSGNFSSFPGQGTNGTIYGLITVSGGTLSLSNSGTISTGTGVRLATSTQAFSQTGGSFSNTNASTGTVTAGNGSVVHIASTTSLMGGTFSNTNNAAVNGGNATVGSVAGSYFLSSGALTLGGSSVTLANTGTISPSSLGATGSLMKVLSITTSGSGSTLTMTNTGTVENFSGNVGTYLLSSGAMTLGAGTWTATNTGTISTGIGVEINGQTTVSLTGASLSLTNEASADVSAASSVGCQFTAGQTLTFPGGSTSTLTLENSQALSGTGGIGVLTVIGTGSSMAAGTLNILNDAAATIGGTAVAGAEYVITTGDFDQTGGTVSMSNSGTVSSTFSGVPTGIALISGGTGNINLTGGSFSMTNSGSVGSVLGGGIGVLVNAGEALTLGGSNVTLTNTSTGSIMSTSVGSAGCQLSGNGITMSGGTLSLINEGPFSGTANNAGAYLYNSSTGPITFSGGTFTGISNTSAIGQAFGIKITSGPAGVSTAPITVSGAAVTLTNTGNFSPPSSIDGIGTYIQGSTLTVSAGSLSLNNTGNLNAFQSQGTDAEFVNVVISGTGAMSLLNGDPVTPNLSGSISGSLAQEGVRIYASQTFSQTGGTYSNMNTGTNSAITGVGSLTKVLTTTTLSGGTLSNINQGNVTAGNEGGFGLATGSYFWGEGSLTLGGTGVTLSNSGAISASGSVATGSLMNMGSITTSGSGSALTITNSGSISTFSGNIGTQLFSAGAMTLGAGTWTATNTGAISTGIGVQINGQTTVSLTGASISLTNEASADVSAANSFGCQFIAGQTLTFPSGSTSTLTLENSQALSGTGGVGVLTTVGTGSSMAAGTLNILNDTGATISGTAIAGAQYVITTGDFDQTGGTVSLSNSGTVNSTFTGVPAGVALSSAGSGNINLTGGNFSMTNSGSISAGGVGVIVNGAGALTVGGSTLTVTNTGSITSTSKGTVGCQLSGSGVTLSGGSLTLINDGAFSGTDSNVGAYLYNSSTGPMTFSGGTFTGTNNSISVGNSFGIKLISGPAGVSTAPIIVSGAAVTLTNTANLGPPNSTYGIGAYIQGSSLTLSAGSLSLNNTGDLTSFVSQGTNGEFASIAISGGTMSLLNGDPVTPNLSGTLSGSGAQQGIKVFASSTFTQTGGAYSNINTGTNSSGTGMGSLTEIAGAVTLSGGTLSNINQGNVSVGNSGVFGQATGSYFFGEGALTLGATSVTLSNSGTISASGSAATGSLMNIPSITSGSGNILTMTNSGPISGFNGNIGTSLLSTGAMALGAGTWTATNTGGVTSGTGVQIEGETTVSLTAASFTMINDITATVSGTGFGGQFIVGQTLSFPRKCPTLTLQNNQTMTSGVGVQATISTGVSMSTGALNITNTGNLSETATGAAMLVLGGLFGQTGGTITVSNSGTNSGSGNASYIQSTPAITVSCTGVFNNPNALVAAPALTIYPGGLLQSGTATIPGVFVDAAFGNTTLVTNDGGTFVSGTLDASGQTTVNGTFTQSSGTYTVVIGNLNLPSNQGISFLTVNGTGSEGVVNLDGDILNVIPSADFNFDTDIPSGTTMVQFIQASTVINGGFTSAQITNSVPGLVGMTYETMAGNEGWLLFTLDPPLARSMDDQARLLFTPDPPTPSSSSSSILITPRSTPVPYSGITVSTINFINTFLGGKLLRMQNQFVTREENQENGDNQPRHSNKSTTSSRAHRSMPQSPKGSSQTIAHPILAATPQLGSFNLQSETKQQQLASEISNGKIIQPWNVYFGPLGDFGSISPKHSQLGAHYRSVGGLAGFDYRFSQVGLGLLVDYENVKAKLHKHAGDFGINQFHATAYTTYVPKSLPQFALNGMIGAGGAWYNIHRNIFGLAESTKANPRGAEVDALIGAQYLFSPHQFASIPCGLEIAPLLNLQYIYQGMGSYKEHGAGVLDLKFHKQGFQSLRSTLGTWLQYIWNWKNFSFTPLFNVAWQREYLDRNHKVQTTPIHATGPEDNITIFGAGRDTLLVGLDLLFEFYDNYGLEANYEFEYNSLYRNNGFYVGFNIRF